ncbi:cation/calcium exchanger 1-like [Coffea eugenioides]|uniref:cation/calcium exchanger 1-like n=1 Tax=Coffea eugenioides TaxID=49369 RepID=UPI000F60546C|nr:cation/calcium exchanger 1-like [Coffea eugenioides]
MGLFLFMHKAKCLIVFLNISFLVLILCISINLKSSNSNFLNNFVRAKSPLIKNYHILLNEDSGCKGLHKYNSRFERCLYVKSHQGCQPQGYISYLELFHCTFSPRLGYTLLAIWLVLLFYLLGDTASSYFCTSLEGLSRCLRLSPTIAGVTLLSLGNGAPDVFSSIISFMGDGNTEDIGLNSILGGAFFVSSVVVGIISISISHQGRKISSSSFTRNVSFLLFCLCCLLLIIIMGKINLWGALSFLALYFIYAGSIFASEILAKGEKEAESAAKTESWRLPLTRSFVKNGQELSTELQTPLLGFADDDSPILNNYDEDNLQILKHKDTVRCCFWKTLFILELPLDLPRKLTIPIISEERWSKPIALMSTALAPVLLAVIWNFHYQKSWLPVYIIAASLGIASALLLFCTSDESNPPRKYQFLWLAEAFLLSIIWTYILAQELISLLVSLGIILGISHSIMGLTVLAWGNSLGDLVSNVTMARRGGPAGAQTAISGCYAGPIFNIIVGLGLSLTLSSWNVFPSSLVLTKDPSVYVTFGFLMVGLIWVLVVLTNRNMRLDRFLGIGLLAIYFCFLFLKMANGVGFVEFRVTSGSVEQRGD